MNDELAGLYITIGADLSGLQTALAETRFTLDELQAEGGLLGGMVFQTQADMQTLVAGIQQGLAPLPTVLKAGLQIPITQALDAISQLLEQRVQQMIQRLYQAARMIHETALKLGVKSPINVSALEGRAAGGQVTAGTPYLVGEVGPELFVPHTSGTIIPNHALGGGKGMEIRGGTFHIYGVQNAESLYDQLQAIAQRRGA